MSTKPGPVSSEPGAPAVLDCLAPPFSQTGISESVSMPLAASRPTNLPLAGDAGLLLALIALIYLGFRRISSQPAIPTAIALCVLFYGLVNERWWNLAAIEVDADGVTSRSWVGGESRLAWSEIDQVRCASGSMFPVFQDDASLVLTGRSQAAPSNISIVEIPRFLDRYPELAQVIRDRLPRLVAPMNPTQESPDVRP